MTGASVMVVEILGTRIIGPVLGIGLFVWSALLSVTLASLAIGYFAGGVISDRYPAARTLNWTVALAGAALCASLALTPTVLAWSEAMGPRAGSLFGASLLFAPALTALGMTGPIAVGLVTVDAGTAGRRVGLTYAVSTAGSLVATLVTGFVLVPKLEATSILWCVAGALLVCGVGPLIARGRAKAAGLLAVLGLAGIPTQRELPDGIQVLERTQSLHGLVEVIEDSNRQVRLLRMDHSILGAQSTVDGSAAFAFVHVLASLRFARPQAHTALMLGLGIGSLATKLEPFGIKSDIVEIDPEIVRLAKAHFGFSPNGEVFVEDARTFLRRTDRRYDFIVHDTFSGGTTPPHLLSVEVARRVQELLQPKGVLALNFVGMLKDGQASEATHAIRTTLQEVFTHVQVFTDSPPEDVGDAPANILFFASDAGLNLRPPTDARFASELTESIARRAADWEVPARGQPGRVITDARNPLAQMQMPVFDAHFRAMQELLPASVWVP